MGVLEGPVPIIAYPSTGEYMAFGQPAEIVTTDGPRCGVCGRTVGPHGEVTTGFVVVAPGNGQQVVCVQDADVREPDEEDNAHE